MWIILTRYQGPIRQEEQTNKKRKTNVKSNTLRTVSRQNFE